MKDFRVVVKQVLGPVAARSVGGDFHVSRDGIAVDRAFSLFTRKFGPLKKGEAVSVFVERL